MAEEKNAQLKSTDSALRNGRNIPLHRASLEAEHERIAAILEKATKAFNQHSPSSEVNRILLELSGYTLSHFNEEEELMRACKYAGFKEHKQEHEELSVHIRGLLDMRSKQDALQGALNALDHWLRSHLRVADKQFFEFLNQAER